MVGLGEVGLRLCAFLRGLGVPVVAVERDDEAPTLRRANEQRIPVVIGRGASEISSRASRSRGRGRLPR